MVRIKLFHSFGVEKCILEYISIIMLPFGVCKRKMKPITENIIELSSIEFLQSLGWQYVNGKEISPEGIFREGKNLAFNLIISQPRRGAMIIEIKSISQINPEGMIYENKKIYFTPTGFDRNREINFYNHVTPSGFVKEK